MTIARVKSGDRAALGALLERHAHYLRLLVRLQLGRRLRPKFDVDDLLQDVYLEVHQRIDRFEGTSPHEFLGWLRRIVATVLSNKIRHYVGTKRRDVRLERPLSRERDSSSAPVEPGLVSSQSSPSHVASRRELGLLLADALATLPEDYREVIILRQLEDLPFAEVALRMGRTVESVKHLWVRALARLRRKVETYG